jgi:hypothetical protein
VRISADLRWSERCRSSRQHLRLLRQRKQLMLYGQENLKFARSSPIIHPDAHIPTIEMMGGRAFAGSPVEEFLTMKV